MISDFYLIVLHKVLFLYSLWSSYITAPHNLISYNKQYLEFTMMAKEYLAIIGIFKRTFYNLPIINNCAIYIQHIHVCLLGEHLQLGV